MELEELKALWTAPQMNLGGTRRALRGLSMGLRFEMVALAVVVVLLGSFAADHVHEPASFVSALSLWAYGLAILIGNVRQLVAVRSIDFDEPVVAIQLRIEQLRLQRAKIVGWLLLFGPLLWLPAAAVVLRSVFGIDLYANASPAWIAGNVLFGVAVIPVCIWIARAFGNQLGGSPAMRSLIDAIAGHNVTAALESLEAVRRFEQAA